MSRIITNAKRRQVAMINSVSSLKVSRSANNAKVATAVRIHCQNLPKILLAMMNAINAKAKLIKRIVSIGYMFILLYCVSYPLGLGL